MAEEGDGARLAPSAGRAADGGEWDVVVVGGGPAGLAAAAHLARGGAGRVLVVERQVTPGGVPSWYRHMRTFGLFTFGRLMTGNAFARRLIAAAEGAGVSFATGTHVLEVRPKPFDWHQVLAVNEWGLHEFRARCVILATGCREGNRASAGILGPRPAGIFNTSTLLQLVDQYGAKPGNRVVVSGSEYVGFSAARLCRLAGAESVTVVEEKPYSLGDFFGRAYFLLPARIPLYTGMKILEVEGRSRLQGVVVAPVDPAGGVRYESARTIPCDTLVLTGRFTPNAELCRGAGVAVDPRTGGPVVDEQMRTSVPGVYACGNVLRGAESADCAVREGRRAAAWALRYLADCRDGRVKDEEARWIPVAPGPGVQYVIPQRISWESLRKPGLPLWLEARTQRLVAREWIEVVSNSDFLGRRFVWRATPVQTIRVGVRIRGEGQARLAGGTPSGAEEGWRVQAASERFPARP